MNKNIFFERTYTGGSWGKGHPCIITISKESNTKIIKGWYTTVNGEVWNWQYDTGREKFYWKDDRDRDIVSGGLKELKEGEDLHNFLSQALEDYKKEFMTDIDILMSKIGYNE